MQIGTFRMVTCNTGEERSMTATLLSARGIPGLGVCFCVACLIVHAGPNEFGTGVESRYRTCTARPNIIVLGPNILNHIAAALDRKLLQLTLPVKAS